MFEVGKRYRVDIVHTSETDNRRFMGNGKRR